jgi:acetoin utilization deacetylase AcuC-like enzyme
MTLLRAGGLATKPARDHGLTQIARVHDAGYLQFLETAFARCQALPGSGPILRAPAYAVRHKARRPDAVMGQAGWYLSSVSAPVVEATWTAAVGSAHAAIDAADAVLLGDRYAHALCRPPGHHAHTDMADGFWGSALSCLSNAKRRPRFGGNQKGFPSDDPASSLQNPGCIPQ